MTKNNHLLGETIHSLLKKLNLENKVDFAKIKQWEQTNHQELLNAKLADFLNHLGVHESFEQSREAATKLVDFFINDRFNGLNYQNFPSITRNNNEFNYSSPLIARDIPLLSTCEHHLVPIEGTALIAYKPKHYIIGLNKLNLVLNFFAKRPQLQERLTRQVFVSLSAILETEDIAVVLNARHNCMSLETIDTNTIHSTYEFGGVFNTDLALKTQILEYTLRL